jgi:cobaltochelatase CobT
MLTDTQAIRRRAHYQTLCAATVRAITGDAALDYRNGRLCRDLRPLALNAPHLRAASAAHDPHAEGDLASLRGLADAMALRLVYSDADLYRRLSPEDPVGRLVFELLEQLRCEALVPPGLHGVARNLRRGFEAWSRAFHQSGEGESHIGNLLYTVAQISWSRLSGWPVLEESEGLIEHTRGGIAPLMGVALAGMHRQREQQAAFAVHALDMARLVSDMVREARAEHVWDDETAETDDEASTTGLSLWFDFEEQEEPDEDDDESKPAVVVGKRRGRDGDAEAYRVFTTRHDQEVHPGSLVRHALLAQYRENLDQRIAAQGINVARLAHALRMALAIPQRDGWSFGEEHGRIDGRRLAQLVTSPAERRLFQLERHTQLADCAVTLLIDCSGSMKAHIDGLAVMVDILARALDQAGVSTEVLGFTTGAWNGGRARLDWIAQGRPPAPGRVSEISHLVFKDAHTSWRRARGDIAALFKADMFREGVDGEAIDWACARLAESGKARRIVVVISDGSPMDSATSLANDAGYLDRHLREVVARHDAERDVEILGLGVGLDLSPYYRHCLSVDLSGAPTMTLFAEVVRWIGARRRRLR